MAKRSSNSATAPSEGKETKKVPRDAAAVELCGRRERQAMRTRTVPESAKGAFYDGPDVVTSLKLFDAGTMFDLPREKKTFSLGADPDCDVHLPIEGLSRLHCVIERRGQAIRVHDQESKNGTFYNGRKEQTFDVRPGATFTVATTRLLAMNDVMWAAYPTLADIVGSEDEHSERESRGGNVSASELVVLATSGGHLLITGPVGCDQLRLARTVHSISLLRSRKSVEVADIPTDRARQREILDQAARSSLILTVEPDAPVMDSAFASMLFSSGFHVRVIAIAPSISKANDVLSDANVRSMRHFALNPLAYRKAAVLQLLDRMLAERGSSYRVSDLSSENQVALQAYGWPNNFDELRDAADKLVAVMHQPLRRAAEILGMSHTTLHYWLTQRGLSFPRRVR